ncbi:tetratricopeptide repeat protein [Kitasatospora sp. NPDC048545]|uniref:ATP-binding protein n=1 Tax=Kitasatospora sp. NPDC048545 TaxID=3157208 RepID=UPI0033D7A35B
MAQTRKRLSRTEALRRRSRAQFVGRRAQLALFAENLRKDPDPEATDDPAEFLFHVRGVGGVGKSALISEWREAAQRSGALTAVVDENDVRGVETALGALAKQLAEQVGPLKDLDRALDQFRRASQAAVDHVPEQPVGGGAASLPSRMVTQAAFGAASMLPGAGVVAALANPDNVALGADRLIAGMRQRRRSHDGEEAALSRAFVAELTKLCGRGGRWVVLFLDTWELTGQYLDGWLRDLLDGAYGEVPLDVVVVLAGREELSERDWGALRPAVVDVPLDVFTEQETRELLAARGVTAPEVVEAVTGMSMRLPLLVALLAQTDLQAVDDIAEAGADLTDHAVRRFLQWIPEPERRETVLAAALPLQLNHDLFTCAVPQAPGDAWDWLLNQPFVSGRGTYRQYHAVVRANMLRRQRMHSPVQWSAAHGRLVQHFSAAREAVERRLPRWRYRGDERWRRHALNETYHGLCADAPANLTQALEHLARIVGDAPTDLAAWSTMLTRAAQDSGDVELAEWASRLGDAAEAEQPELEALTALCGPESPPQVRAWALAHRGDRYFALDRYEESTADLDRAVALSPGLPEARAFRGRNHAMNNRTEQALADLDVALGIDPVFPWALGYRGVAQIVAGRPGEAVPDFDAALALDPEMTWILWFRGQANGLVGQWDRAMSDLTEAHRLTPGAGWLLARRGEVHLSAGRPDEALADFTASLELDPGDVWALGTRGDIHRSAGRLDEAVADFGAALALDPELTWLLGFRGQAHWSAGRPDEAMADFDAALEQDPHRLPWVFELRGQAHRSAGRLDEAVADFSAALASEPGAGRLFAQRGEAHRLAGRLDQAVADLSAAVALNSRDGWALAQRGEVHRLSGRYDEALADLTAACDTDPANAWTLTTRAMAYVESGRFDEAVADYSAVIDRCPDHSRGALVTRGDTHRMAGRLHEAVTDLTAALALDPEDKPARGCLGQAQGLLGRFDEAAANLSEAVDDTPASLWMSCALIAVHRRNGRLQDARTALNRAARVDPEDVGLLAESAVLQLTENGRAASLAAWNEYREAAHGSGSAGESSSAELLHGLVAGDTAPDALVGEFLAEPGVSVVLVDVRATVEELARAELPVGPRAEAALRLLGTPVVP